MNALSNLLALPETEKAERGLRHTPAEIAQQPQTWRSTFEVFCRRREEIIGFLGQAGVWAEDPASRPTVLLLGAGTSDYIGQSLTYLLRKLWLCEVTAVPSTDLLTHQQEIILPHRRYLWISFSRSGDSPEGVAVLERALEARPDILHLIVTCNARGRMVRETAGRKQALSICLDDAVNDRGLAMTSSFSNMVVFGQCLAHARDFQRYVNVFENVVQAGKRFLPAAADCGAELSRLPLTKAYMVGSGPLRAVARESALKLLELTAGKTLSMSESALGLRHGPMAALDENTLFICFLSGSPRVQKFELDLLEEICQKGLVRHRIVVAGNGQLFDNASEQELASISAPVLTDDYRPPVDVIFGQLLGLFFSLKWNLQPDTPSPTGAISRVVHNVTIHA